MDAKFKKDRDTKFSISTIREFITMKNDLQTINAATIDLQFNHLIALKANCLLSNGNVIAKHQQYCTNNNVKQIGAFVHNTSNFNVIG